jgi:hypothetical protein
VKNSLFPNAIQDAAPSDHQGSNLSVSAFQPVRIHREFARSAKTLIVCNAGHISGIFEMPGM